MLDPHDSGVLLTLREHPQGPMVSAYNVTATERWVWGDRLRDLGLDPDSCVDRISGEAPHLAGPGDVRLRPYQAVWLTARLTLGAVSTCVCAPHALDAHQCHRLRLPTGDPVAADASTSPRTC